MSGIYIPGMEMPPKGEYKPIFIYDTGEVTMEIRGEEVQIATAIPVLDHGRLGDLDAFWDRLKNTKSVLGFGTAKEYQIYDMGFLAGFRAAVKIALEMPTVIPADRRAGE